jgi:hypothetical protein
MSRYQSMRASDADREAVTERLRQAAAEGRIDHEELEERVETALRARTYGELGPLVADLPSERAPKRRTHPALVGAAALAVATMVAVAAVIVIVAIVVTGAFWVAAVLFWMVCCRPRRRLRSGYAWRHRTRVHRARPTGLL